MIRWGNGIISFSRVSVYLDLALLKGDYFSLPLTDEESEKCGSYVT